MSKINKKLNTLLKTTCFNTFICYQPLKILFLIKFSLFIYFCCQFAIKSEYKIFLKTFTNLMFLDLRKLNTLEVKKNTHSI